jgi:arylsulfatase A-like enzyme
VNDQRPNLLFMMADDHAAHAIGAYGSRVNETPGIDRLAGEGMRLDNCFCTNSLCSPSRAAILTGTYNHVNGVTSNSSKFDSRRTTYVSLLQAAGYQTYISGKWHLGHGGIHDPRGFDRWAVLEGHGTYNDPEFLTADGRFRRPGYATDVITDLALEWLAERDPARPFCMLIAHKAPHREWIPAERHATLYEDRDIAEPGTLRDDYTGRASPAREATMTIKNDLTDEDLKAFVPAGLSDDEELRWKYRRFITDYLRCVAALDENMARVLDWLDEQGVAGNTVVVYTSDQGFFLGDHGWYDKRFMYEESLRMPFLVRYPREIPAGSTSAALALNVDFGPTFLDYAGVPVPGFMQGRSLRGVLRGEAPPDWRTSMYYRYWVHYDVAHHVWAHYGVRTQRHKLVYYYAEPCDTPGAFDEPRTPEWELFDLEQDPLELHSVYGQPAYADVTRELKRELRRLQQELGDTDCAPAPEGDE